MDHRLRTIVEHEKRYNAQSAFEVMRDTENEHSPLKIRLPPELKSTIWISVKVESSISPPNMSQTTGTFSLRNFWFYYFL